MKMIFIPSCRSTEPTPLKLSSFFEISSSFFCSDLWSWVISKKLLKIILLVFYKENLELEFSNFSNCDVFFSVREGKFWQFFKISNCDDFWTKSPRDLVDTALESWDIILSKFLQDKVEFDQTKWNFWTWRSGNLNWSDFVDAFEVIFPLCVVRFHFVL